MNIMNIIEKKRITDAQLYDLISPGDRIFFSSGPVTPVTTLQGIMRTMHGNLKDLEFILTAPIQAFFREQDCNLGKYRLKTFIVGENIAKKYATSFIDFIPTTIAELPYLFVSGAVETDVAIVQVSSPDRSGNVSLGPVHDIARLVIDKSPLVIAEINPRVPRTHGETSIPMNAFDYIIERDAPLLSDAGRDMDETEKEIGRQVSYLIENGATLSMGLGGIFNAIAASLKGKKDLSICSHVVSDWIIDLAESDTMARQCAFNNRGPVATTSCIGSENLFRFIDNNRAVAVLPLLNSYYQKELSRIPRLTSIVDVEKIDVSGDTVSIAGNEYNLDGFDSKLNFSTAATHSRDGKSIVVLRSTDEQGQSNILINHSDRPEKVRSMLGSTRYVVSEFGIAAVFGKTIRERAIAMIDIAHPRHRESLILEAKRAGIMYPDQIYCVDHAMNYPRDLEEVKTFHGGGEIFFRPIKVSDEEMMRRLFYKISENTVYMRYLTSVRTMPHSRMQPYVNIDYRDTLSLVGIVQKRGIEHIIAEGRFARNDDDKTHEIAFIVDEVYQGMGIGSYMVDRIIGIARDRGISKLTAYVLAENEKMSRVLERAAVLPDILHNEHEKEYTFLLNDGLAMRDTYTVI